MSIVENDASQHVDREQGDVDQTGLAAGDELALHWTLELAMSPIGSEHNLLAAIFLFRLFEVDPHIRFLPPMEFVARSKKAIVLDDLRGLHLREASLQSNRVERGLAAWKITLDSVPVICATPQISAIFAFCRILSALKS